MTPSQPKSGEMSDSKADSKAGLSVGRSSSEDLPPARPEAHTPGPWRFTEGAYLYVNGTDVSGKRAFIIQRDLKYQSKANQLRIRADVRLIAAAPDLLAAAQCAANVLFLLQDEVKALGCNAKNVPQQLRAAIALATKDQS